MTRKKKSRSVTLVTLRLNWRQGWSTPACRAHSKDLNWLETERSRCTSAKVEDAEPEVSAGFVAAVPSGDSSAYPPARPPRSTSVSVTYQRGLSALRETTHTEHESQQRFQPSPSRSLAAELSEVGPHSALEHIMIYKPLTFLHKPRAKI